MEQHFDLATHCVGAGVAAVAVVAIVVGFVVVAFVGRTGSFEPFGTIGSHLTQWGMGTLNAFPTRILMWVGLIVGAGMGGMAVGFQPMSGQLVESPNVASPSCCLIVGSPMACSLRLEGRRQLRPEFFGGPGVDGGGAS